MAKGFIKISDEEAANGNDTTQVPRPNPHTNGQDGGQQVDQTSNANTAQLHSEHQPQHSVLVTSPEIQPLPPPAYYQQPPQPLPQAQIHALSLQDTENNNVDENSNDQHYQQYTQYHHQYWNHTFIPEPSVRPRTQDELDYSPQRGLSRNTPHQRSHYDGVRHREAPYSNSQEDHLQRAPYSRHCEPSHSAIPRRREPSGHNNRTPSQSQDTTRSIRSWIPLTLRGGSSGRTPSTEETQQEAQELLENFTREEIRNCNLEVPDTLTPHQPRWSNPAWQQTGAELRILADTFAKSSERQQVRKIAESIDMDAMNAENFFELCTELFSGHGGVTRERIVALFTFLADIAVSNLQQYGGRYLQQIMRWSLRFIWDRVCSWVQEAGGWGVVLSTGLNMLYKTAIILFAVTGTVACVMYITKNL